MKSSDAFDACISCNFTASVISLDGALCFFVGPVCVRGFDEFYLRGMLMEVMKFGVLMGGKCDTECWIPNKGGPNAESVGEEIGGVGVINFQRKKSVVTLYF
jgi:hypothetical protein